MNLWYRGWLLLFLAVALAGCQARRQRSFECIAPANPGGGWDLTCRLIAQAAGELRLLPATLRVTNLPGAGGGMAFAHTVSVRNRDSSLIVAASPATTLRLAQGQYGDLEAGDVRWLAAVGAEYGVLAVAAGAPWRSLDDLVSAWRSNPGRIVVGGGSAVGGQDHMKVLLLADRAGIDPRSIRYVPFDGGGEALTALLGGFIQVFSGEASEIEAQLEAGNVAVVAVLAPERLGGKLAGFPTAKEQGYDLSWITWRGFYVPRGISDSAYRRWVDLMRRVVQSEPWREARNRYGIEPFALLGSDFERFVRAEVETLRGISLELGLIR
ncbi:hypothetical protein HRbin33_00626 [bacterium HR33]|nr:hypothetical protein HRbin33_00626 [bacterium HR33]